MAVPSLLDALRGEPARTALIVPDGPTFTYAQLRAAVAEAAERLASLGIRRGDRVAMALPNGAEAIVMFLAASLAGTAAPLNPGYKEEEFAFYLEDTGARLLLVRPGEGEAARRAMGARGRVVEVAFQSSGRLWMDGGPEGRATPSPPEPDDVALVLHTSGTTSRPKRVPLRHRNLLASLRNIEATYQLTPDDVSLCVMPLFHVHGLMASTLSALWSGGVVVAPESFTPLAFWPVARRFRPTWYSASPTFHSLILLRAGGESPPPGGDRLRFVRSCSSALTPRLQAELEARLGAPVLNAYGMTEASHQMASNPLPPAPRRPGTVGRGTGVEVALAGEAGGLLPPGASGEVVIRGPNVIDGYEGSPEANATAFFDGWFRTGDVGTLDADGYLTLVGRLKELINRGGEKIAPAEIDGVLEANPKVKEAVAFGAPHPAWGEEVAAAVVLAEPATEKELAAWCRDRLAEFKVPKRFHIVDQIPRTATGKVQRKNVAAHFNRPG